MAFVLILLSPDFAAGGSQLLPICLAVTSGHRAVRGVHSHNISKYQPPDLGSSKPINRE